MFPDAGGPRCAAGCRLSGGAQQQRHGRSQGERQGRSHRGGLLLSGGPAGGARGTGRR